MLWKYHIPHKWESSDERNIWEDIYLMPDINLSEVQRKVSVWLTVDALGNTPLAEDEEGWELYWKDVERLKTSDYIIDQKTCNMIVKVEDFNLKELLEYVKLFDKSIDIVDPKVHTHRKP